VETLVDGELPAGEHLATWNRAQRSGAAGAAGVFFYELRAGGRRTTKRIIVLR
jgi:predicted hotdog family 3-hydroxylacyl-ACP dehydratase